MKRIETTFRTITTPVGPVRVAVRGRWLVGVHTGTQLDSPAPPDWRESPALRVAAIEQLEEYFAGARREFDLAIDLDGTPFQMQVWRALARIPFAETISYRELAERVGREAAVRAVGGANARNPISIILPCHRVIGARGRLTGYAGGLGVKAALLEHERAVLGAGRDRTGGGSRQENFDGRRAVK